MDYKDLVPPLLQLLSGCLLSVPKNVCVARVCGYDHPDCGSVRQKRQQAGTIVVVAEGAFCVGLGLAGKQNTAFVRQKGV